MRANLNNRGLIEVKASGQDVCKKCKNLSKCPLIQAIKQEIVILHYEETLIADCGLRKG